MTFDTISIDEIADFASTTLDNADYGIIGLDGDNKVIIYNATESRLAGLSRERVVGRDFFVAVAPCMNNFMVAQRFADSEELDESLDYVLTLRMKPTPVRLRLIQSSTQDTHFILVRR